ncbi:ankyrin repeat domain-containing protein [Leeuwenhoekiella parthenopeia]|uniref:Ankyrin repeat domain-containing protein n=1 Tax=Leeuwenhoekiella parthenopeia TaxID=2890320 RepID=A0ABS8GYM9_9FLAO|nr:ankyrin repeat domain-containing protein [Leeuwenhoekiella parthenopeia]
MGLRLCFFIFLAVCSVSELFSQEAKDFTSLQLGFTVDIRFTDGFDLDKSSVISDRGFSVFTETKNQKLSALKLKTQTPSSLNYYLLNTTQEFEQQILQVDTSDRAFSAQYTKAYNTNVDAAQKDKLLFVYTLRKVPLYDLRLSNTTLSEAFTDAVKRLGRDLSPEGFISWFGTHYTDHVTYGGIFLTRNFVSNADFINSPYTEDAFKEELLKEVGRQQRGDSLTNPYINLGPPQRFTRGGDVNEIWDERWAQTVTKANAVILDANLVELTNLLSTKNFPDVPDLDHRRYLLQAAIDRAKKQSVSWQAQEETSDFFKKYSLQFRQKVHTIVKASEGKAEQQQGTDYIGDLFYGSFNARGEPMRTAALIEYQGIDLNTLLTDEEITLNKVLDFTISPEELKAAYVSVWDDTKKLEKGQGRTRLFVSGPPEAHAYFKDALVGVVQKEVEITTIDGDVFKITYSLEQQKAQQPLGSRPNSYNYALSSEVVSAAARGDLDLLRDLYFQGVSTRTEAVVKAAVQNFDDAQVLNTIFDFGVQPTTEDLDVAFDPEVFSKAKALTLLERGAKPKNNMIYKAVAYQEPEVIYALLREGAEPRNNDVAFAVELNNYEVTKALMSLEYAEFKADGEMLALAVTNADTSLTEKFIDYGAVADPRILKLATGTKNQEVIDRVKAVTPASAEALEVVADASDTSLFRYFLEKEKVPVTDAVLSSSILNDNLELLGLALDAGGSANFALSKSILEKNTPAVRLSLKKGAQADPVFEYALNTQDFDLFQDALDDFSGNPQLALSKAVAANNLDFSAYVLKKNKNEVDADTQVALAASNENLELVKLLVTNDARPQTALEESVSIGSVPITQFLIGQGASVKNPELIRRAVKAENVALAGVLLDTKEIDPDAIMLDLIQLKNQKLIDQNLSYGARVDAAALRTALDTKEDSLALNLLQQADAELITKSLLFNAVKNELTAATRYLIVQLQNPDYALQAAFEVKNTEALKLALELGAKPQNQDLITAVKAHFNEALQPLIEAGLDPTVTDNEANSLLHFVAYRYDDGDVRLIEKLVEAGVDVNARNEIGETPLHWAAKAGMDGAESVKTLLRLGALPEARTSKRQSVLDYAEDRVMRQLLKTTSVR